jgi:cobalt/nickel transport system permease protein
VSSILRDVQSLEWFASQSSTLAALDARAKILATAAFTVTVVSFDRYSVAALLPLASFPLILAHMGKIPLRVIGRGILLASPVAIMMGIFNPLFDRQSMILVAGLHISGGWLSFVSILVRFALTVSAGLILIAGTGFSKLCCGLRALGLPEVFVNQLLLLHRYAGVLMEEASRMKLARELRASEKAMHLSVYSSFLGHLLLRSLERAQRIHHAMLSRGFNGNLPRHVSSQWQPHDTLFVVLCLLGFALSRMVDPAQWLGHMVLRWIV